MSNFGPIGLIVLMGIMPFMLLGLLVAGLSGGVAWKPVPLWTDQFGWGDSRVTSVAAYHGELFAAGYFRPILSPNFPPITPELQFFLKQYDQNGHEVWTKTFGHSSPSNNDETLNWPAITVGTDGVYFTVAINDSIQIRKFDLKGDQVWTIPVPQSYSTRVAISAGNGGLYVAGSAQEVNPSRLFLEKYDSSGVQLWTRQFGNSSGQVKAVYAGPLGVYVVGWVVESLPGHTLLGKSDAFMVTYDNGGNPVKTDEFSGPCAVDEATDVSGDGGAVYVTGLTGLCETGFVRKYGLDGSAVQTIHFSPIGAGMFGSSISSNASGVYVFAESSHIPFAMKFDSNLNQIWKFELQEQIASMAQTIAVGTGGVYFSGSGSTNLNAKVMAFSLDSSLILFWLNPPYSFVILAAIPIGIALALFLDKRLKNRRATQEKPLPTFDEVFPPRTSHLVLQI